MSLSLEQLAITETETLDEVIECLAENFSIKTQGACDKKTLFEILVRAASNGDTIESTAKTLQKIPLANDIRYHLIFSKSTLNHILPLTPVSLMPKI